MHPSVWLLKIFAVWLEKSKALFYCLGRVWFPPPHISGIAVFDFFLSDAKIYEAK